MDGESNGWLRHSARNNAIICGATSFFSHVTRRFKSAFAILRKIQHTLWAGFIGCIESYHDTYLS
jgi:hypothetical protein